MQIIPITVTAVVLALVGGVAATYLHERGMERRSASPSGVAAVLRPVVVPLALGKTVAPDAAAAPSASGWTVVSASNGKAVSAPPLAPPKALRTAAAELLAPHPHCRTLLEIAAALPLVDADSKEGKDNLAHLQESASITGCLNP